jgi:serine/threonine protein kinase
MSSQYTQGLKDLISSLLQVDPQKRPSLDQILEIDMIKLYNRGHSLVCIPKSPLSDEVKLHGRTISLKTSNFDSPYLHIERARILFEEECGSNAKDYYEAVRLHLQYSYPLPPISLDIIHLVAQLIFSERLYYHRPWNSLNDL